MQIGGPYLPQSYKRLRLQFPGNHGGVNWGWTSFNPQLGYLFVNTNEMGQPAGLQNRDPKSTGRARKPATRCGPSGWAVPPTLLPSPIWGRTDDDSIMAFALPRP